MLTSEFNPIGHHSDADMGAHSNANIGSIPIPTSEFILMLTSEFILMLTSEFILMLTSEFIPMLTSELIPIVHQSDADIGVHSDCPSFRCQCSVHGFRHCAFLHFEFIPLAHHSDVGLRKMSASEYFLLNLNKSWDQVEYLTS